MRHAVVAARAAPRSVALPVGLVHQGAEARGVSLVGEQVARPLPAEDVVGGIAPGRALIGLVAGQEIEEQPRMIERPALAASSCAASPEDLAEQPLARATPEEHVLAGRMGVAVAWGNRDALDLEPHLRIDVLCNSVRCSAGE